MDFVKRTIDLAKKNVEEGGRPFACVIAKDGKVLAESANLVIQTHDPTAHAEMQAIRKASAILQSENFTGCEFYILAHPCPMCLAAMYYCSPDRVIFITTRDDYSHYYVDDRKYFTLLNFYDEIGKPWQKRKMPMIHQPDPEGIEVYELWQKLNAPKKLLQINLKQQLRLRDGRWGRGRNVGYPTSPAQIRRGDLRLSISAQESKKLKKFYAR